jgi:hypothetical protein
VRWRGSVRIRRAGAADRRSRLAILFGGGGKWVWGTEERPGLEAALFVDVSLRAARCASSNHGAGQPTYVPRNYNNKSRSEALRFRLKVAIFSMDTFVFRRSMDTVKPQDICPCRLRRRPLHQPLPAARLPPLPYLPWWAGLRSSRPAYHRTVYRFFSTAEDRFHRPQINIPCRGRLGPCHPVGRKTLAQLKIVSPQNHQKLRSGRSI